MARPSNRQQRSEEILDAYEKCVALYGVEGATLELTAKEAGIARSLIRHHIGNRDILLQALIKRFFTASQYASKELTESLPKTQRLATLIDWLFDPTHSNPQQLLVAGALISACSSRPELSSKMKKWFQDFITLVTRELKAENPNTTNENLDAIAMGITALYFNADALSPLGKQSTIHPISKRAALLLMDSLN